MKDFKEQQLNQNKEIQITSHNTYFSNNYPTYNMINLYNKIRIPLKKRTQYKIFKKMMKKILWIQSYYSIEELFNEVLDSLVK